MTEAEAKPLNVAGLSAKDGLEALQQLAERFDMNLMPRKFAVDWAKADASGHASENADGVIVLKLHTPIEFGEAKDKVTRVTMRRIKVRDMRRAEVGLEVDLRNLTASLVEPPVFDDLESDDDAWMFLAAGARQLGKFRGVPPTTSAAPSATSEGTLGSPRLI